MPIVGLSQNVEFYAQALFNPHWGEQIVFAPKGVLSISCSSTVSTRSRPRRRGVRSSTGSRRRRKISVLMAPKIIGVPARRFWDPALLKTSPGFVISDDRPGAPEDNIFYAGNLDEAGRVWHAYQSAWLPASLLQDDQRERLADALFAAAKHRGVALHFNKGLAGAAPEAIAAARDTAMNPAVVDAFALAISGGGGPPAYPGVPGHEPDEGRPAKRAAACRGDERNPQARAPRRLLCVGDRFFQPHWQDAFWGENYARLRAVKGKYDPDGLFFLHHGVGSEDWSADGFTRVK